MQQIVSIVNFIYSNANDDFNETGILKKTGQAYLLAILHSWLSRLAPGLLPDKIAQPVQAKEFAMEKLTAAII